MNIIYITAGIGPVFQSQVVELLNCVSKKLPDAQITLAIGIRVDAEKEKILNLNHKIKLVFFKTSQQYPVLDLMMQKSLESQLKQLKITDRTVFHLRGEYMGIIFYKAFKNVFAYDPRLFMDIRGASYEEIAGYLKQGFLMKIKLFYLKKLFEKYALKAKLVNVVSDELKKYVLKTYHFNTENIVVNHCIAGERFFWDIKIRENIRKKLEIKDNETLFVFSSSTGGKWQNGDGIAMALAQQGYKILMLTKKSYSHKNILNMFVPYDDVPGYLMAADIGIIIRDEDTVNKVSSPIKFSEYLSCGLPVIANDSVILICDVIKKYNCGAIVNNLENLDEKVICDLKMIDRGEIANIGKELFSLETIGDGYLKSYEKLINENIFYENTYFNRDSNK